MKRSAILAPAGILLCGVISSVSASPLGDAGLLGVISPTSAETAGLMTSPASIFEPGLGHILNVVNFQHGAPLLTVIADALVRVSVDLVGLDYQNGLFTGSPLAASGAQGNLLSTLANVPGAGDLNGSGGGGITSLGLVNGGLINLLR